MEKEKKHPAIFKKCLKFPKRIQCFGIWWLKEADPWESMDRLSMRGNFGVVFQVQCNGTNQKT